jgi:HPt (histidine-containing phosphotransfer) domain-containing protein
LPEAGLQGLRLQFIARTRDDYAVLKRHQQSDNLRSPDMIAVVHRMAGTAGMLGYSEISAIAGRLDDELAEGSTRANETLGDLLAALEEAISQNGANN